MNIRVSPAGVLFCGSRRFRCAIGKGGIHQVKREGDGRSPAGCFPLRRVLYRADRLCRPVTALPAEPLAPDEGWCDDPADPHYNRQVSLPHPGRCENLWREDHVYDVIVVIGYNEEPAIPGAGSAIFMHVARPGFEPTEGCIALTLPDLLAVLEQCDVTTDIMIG